MVVKCNRRPSPPSLLGASIWETFGKWKAMLAAILFTLVIFSRKEWCRVEPVNFEYWGVKLGFGGGNPFWWSEIGHPRGWRFYSSNCWKAKSNAGAIFNRLVSMLILFVHGAWKLVSDVAALLLRPEIRGLPNSAYNLSFDWSMAWKALIDLNGWKHEQVGCSFVWASRSDDGLEWSWPKCGFCPTGVTFSNHWMVCIAKACAHTYFKWNETASCQMFL